MHAICAGRIGAIHFILSRKNINPTLIDGFLHNGRVIRSQNRSCLEDQFFAFSVRIGPVYIGNDGYKQVIEMKVVYF